METKTQKTTATVKTGNATAPKAKAKTGNGRKKATVKEVMNEIQPPVLTKVETVKTETTPKRDGRGRRPNADIEAKGQVVRQGGRTMIDPKDVLVDWDSKALGSNPRTSWGKNEKDWQLFVDSIRDKGVQQSVKLYIGQDNKWHLRHGFRRMKAVQELLAAGHPIELIPFDEVPDNEEEALVDHFDLNNGKPLTDIEAAEGLRRLRQLTGIKNVMTLAKRVHIPYIKATNLLNFADQASTRVKQAVVAGKLSFSMGKNIVLVSKSTTEQNALLKEGEEAAKEAGKSKIRIKNIGKVKEVKLPVEKKLIEILNEAIVTETNTPFALKVRELVEAVQNGKTTKEVLGLLSEAHV